ncbi:Retrovirus-related Pol Polyprotein from transposon 17.6, partial [Phytophthora megakarya]
KSMGYLGHLLSGNGVQPLDRLITAVTKFPRPKDPEAVRRFVHLAGYYRRFLQGFGSIVEPPTRLLKKNVEWHWTELQEFAFERAKMMLTTRPLLLYPDFERPFRLVTNASQAATTVTQVATDEATVLGVQPADVAGKTAGAPSTPVTPELVTPKDDRGVANDGDTAGTSAYAEHGDDAVQDGYVVQEDSEVHDDDANVNSESAVDGGTARPTMRATRATYTINDTTDAANVAATAKDTASVVASVGMKRTTNDATKEATTANGTAIVEDAETLSLHSDGKAASVTHVTRMMSSTNGTVDLNDVVAANNAANAHDVTMTSSGVRNDDEVVANGTAGTTAAGMVPASGVLTATDAANVDGGVTACDGRKGLMATATVSPPTDLMRNTERETSTLGRRYARNEQCRSDAYSTHDDNSVPPTTMLSVAPAPRTASATPANAPRTTNWETTAVPRTTSETTTPKVANRHTVTTLPSTKANTTTMAERAKGTTVLATTMATTAENLPATTSVGRDAPTRLRTKNQDDGLGDDDGDPAVAETTLQLTDNQIISAQKSSRFVRKLVNDGTYQGKKIETRFGLVSAAAKDGWRVVLLPALWAVVFTELHGSV